MTLNAVTPARPHAQLLEPDEIGLLRRVGGLSRQGRRILVVAVRRVMEVEDTEGEDAACDLIDELIGLIRRP